MTIIHMETEQVRSVARQLDATAEQIHLEIERIASQARGIPWQSPRRDQYVAAVEQLRQKIQALAQQGAELSQRVQREVDEWISADGQGAIHFQEIKRSLPDLTPFIAGGGGVILASAQVLGTSTQINAQYSQEYRAMPWQGRYAEQKNLQKQIDAAQKRLNDMRSAEEIQNEINDIDAQLADLERKKKEAQAKADAWYNKVIPDWPLDGDSDGVPWRVKADDFEDEVAEYDRQIQELQTRKQAMLNELNLRQQTENSLVALRERQAALNQVMDAGIPADGPTKPDWLRNQLGGCTNYVAQKRDVSDFGGGHPGHANMWDDQARAAGYEVGEQPAKGAIMVFEGNNDVMKVDRDAGHVAYVENVEKVDGGYKVTISQADTQYDKNGNFIRGTYVNQRTSTVFVKDSPKGVSFIYE